MLSDGPEVQAIIVTGAGDKFFVAGADLKGLKEKGMIETLAQLSAISARTAAPQALLLACAIQTWAGKACRDA